MQFDDRTPTQSGPPPSPAELALQVLARALREVSDSLSASCEVFGAMSSPQRDLALSHAAELVRGCKHLAGEAEQLLQALVGYRSDRPLQVVKKENTFMTNLRKIVAGLGASALAMAGISQFLAKWPTVALVTLIAGTGLTALSINLPQPSKEP